MKRFHLIHEAALYLIPKLLLGNLLRSFSRNSNYKTIIFIVKVTKLELGDQE